MKRRLISALALAVTLGFSPAARAENLELVNRLVSTRECQGCDLTQAGLVFANLQGADLRSANLSLANLNRANLSNANLQRANLSGAVLSSSNLSGADLRGANLQGADLRDAYLANVQLSGANLQGANLRGAVGIPPEVLSANELYIWGLTETQRGNFAGAVGYLNQALTLQPDFAHAYLARGIARFQAGDEAGAIQDGEYAEQLYQQQGNPQGQQFSARFVEGIYIVQEQAEDNERQFREGGAGRFVQFIGGLAGLLLRFML